MDEWTNQRTHQDYSSAKDPKDPGIINEALKYYNVQQQCHVYHPWPGTFFFFKYHLEIHGDDWGMVKWQPVKYPYDF